MVKLNQTLQAGESSGNDLFMPTAQAVRPILESKKIIPVRRETAETMASKQKDIAVSEFFAKNRHLLGFDNPRRRF